MKASAFAYARATSVANALDLLAAHGERAKVLAQYQPALSHTLPMNVQSFGEEV